MSSANYDVTHLGSCEFCHKNLVIENDYPADFLHCGHLLHRKCTVKIQEQGNSCPAVECSDFITVIKYIIGDREEGSGFPLRGIGFDNPIPWTFTKLRAADSEGEHTVISAKIVDFLTVRWSLLPGTYREDLPEIWKTRWSDTVQALPYKSFQELLAFYIDRVSFREDDKKPYVLSFIFWASSLDLIETETYFSLLCAEPKFLCDNYPKSIPVDWQNKWTQKIVELGAERIQQVVNYNLERPDRLNSDNLLRFLSWAKRNGYIEERFQEDIIIRLVSFNNFMKSLTHSSIQELSKGRGDSDWQNDLKSRWSGYRAYDRWTLVANLIKEGFKAPENLLDLLHENSWGKFRSSCDDICASKILQGTWPWDLHRMEATLRQLLIDAEVLNNPSERRPFNPCSLVSKCTIV